MLELHGTRNPCDGGRLCGRVWWVVDLALCAGKIIPSWDRFGVKVCAWCRFWVRFLQGVVEIRWFSAPMSHQRAVLEHCVNVRRTLPRLRHRCQCPTVPPRLRHR